MAASGSRRSSRARSGVDRRLLVAAVVVAVLPLVVGVVRVVVEGAPPLNGDVALIELRVSDVGTSHTPTLGSYQRYGWNQPGPLLFYALSVPYRLFGAEFAGLQVGALLLNAAAVVGIAVVAARRGGTVPTLWALLVAGVLVRGHDAAQLADPWEPHVSVLPTAFLLLLAFEVLCGGVWALPVAAGAASLLAQAYAAQAATAVAVVLLALVGLGVRTARGTAGWRPLVRPLAVTALVVLVLWAPPLVEQVRGDPGNLTEAWRFLSEDHETLGPGDAWSALSLQFGHRAPWLGVDVPIEVFAPTVDIGEAPAVPIALVALGIGLALAARRRDRSVLLGAVVLVYIGAAAFGLSRLVGDLFPWILEPTRAAGFGAWLAAGWCAYCGLGDGRRRTLDRVLVPLLAFGLLAVSTAAVVDAATHRDADDPLLAALSELTDAAVVELEEVDGPVLLRAEATRSVTDDPITAEVLAAGLEREGIGVVVDPGLANRFGDHRAEPERAVAEARLVTGPPGEADLEGFRLVATIDSMGREQRQRWRRLGEEIQRRAGGAADSLEELAGALEADPELRRLAERQGAITVRPELSVFVRRPA